MGHFSEQYIANCDSRTSDDDYLDRRDGVSSKPVLLTSRPAYIKTITPAFEHVGKRKKLTGYIGELRDGKMLISSMEYSTYSQAESALDALAFELLTDLAERDLIDALPAFDPTTCVYCNKSHHPQHCPEKNALLFAHDAAPAQCAYRGCIQDRTHDDTGFCCYHNEEETGCRCDCEDDDWADAAWESDQGTYNGKVPADFAPAA